MIRSTPPFSVHAKYKQTAMSEGPSKFRSRIDQRSVVLHDPSGFVDHIFNDLLSREDLVYLSGDATGKPRSGAERLFRMLLEVVFVWYNTLVKESLDLRLTVLLPDRNQINGSGRSDRRFPSSPIVDIGISDNP